MIPNVLSIAGSDPSGGAGIQADLKTFGALNCYGMAAMTSLTAQNTKGVSDIHELPHDFVAAQLRMVFEDVRVDAVKIGMAGSPEVIQVIVDMIQKYKPPIVIVDPVMVSQSGHQLVSDAAVKAIKTHLAPLADVLTPNIPEAEVLLARHFEKDMEDFAVGLLKLQSRAVLLKGGHLGGVDSTDMFADKNGTLKLEAARIETKNNHGTGCTLSSALAAYMAKGLPPREAANAAKKYLSGALRESDKLKVGHGHGPVNHFWVLWK